MTLESTNIIRHASREDIDAINKLVSSGDLCTPYHSKLQDCHGWKRHIFLAGQAKQCEHEVLSKGKKTNFSELRSDYMFAIPKFTEGQLFYRDRDTSFPASPAIKHLSQQDPLRKLCWQIKYKNLRQIGFFYRFNIFIACFTLNKKKCGNANHPYQHAIDHTLDIAARLQYSLVRPVYINTTEHENVISDIAN